ncbi:MAG: hypothetical protein SRB1_01334 [Desulfobacteraceae bacterium Eth-SRB1]|nr:MAG: hypothetical protein SRB1_01334 [Desulfobacteraceae bacterium Eth-SRB1]
MSDIIKSQTWPKKSSINQTNTELYGYLAAQALAQRVAVQKSRVPRIMIDVFDLYHV